MKDFLFYSCLLSQLFLLVRAGKTVNNTLKCYQCEIIGRDPNALCEQEDLKTCPNDYAADMCLTSVKRNVSGHYHITRKCALAPCDLPDADSQSLFKLSSNCDRNRDEYTCYKCCNKDACNLNSAPNLKFNLGSGIGITLLLLASGTAYNLLLRT